VNVLPAIVTVPERCVIAVLAATVTDRLPLPVPLPPFVTVSHEALLDEDHAHAEVVETETVLELAAAGATRLCGEIE
jgi:hypothetical protein